METKRLIIVAGALSAVTFGGYFLFQANQGLLEYANREYAEMQQREMSSGQENTDKESQGQHMNEPPEDLSLPLRIQDLQMGQNMMVSPFGIVRRESQDRLDVGHGGIDLPLPPGSPVLAVADGTIIKKRHGADMRAGGGGEIWISLGSGEWAFLYEHIEPLDTLSVGDRVLRGETLGVNALDTVFSTVHLQLAEVFSEERYIRDSRCWVPLLHPQDQERLEAWFVGIQADLLGLWGDIVEEGYLVHGALLDTEQYPNGPQLCYAPGTDARIPMKP